MKNNFISRTITGALIVASVIAILLTNFNIISLAFMFISNLAMYELIKVLEKMGKSVLKTPAYIFNNIFLLVIAFAGKEYALVLLSIYIISLAILIIFDKNKTLSDLSTNIFIAIYITCAYSTLILLKDPKWIGFAIFITAFSDTFAYLVGISIGKHKFNFLKELSPKKTIEGSVGGILGSLLFVYLFKLYFNLNHVLLMYLASILISIVSQFGDLFASYIKRRANVKDYGKILKGHGGIMDRFDSLLFVAPLVYLFVNLLELV